MKTLVNKQNPHVRITAPEITTASPPVSNEGYVYWIPAINQMYNPIDWTLVEEEPIGEEYTIEVGKHTHTLRVGSQSDIDNLIRKEIERRMDKHWDLLPNADSPEDDWTHNELCELGAYKELEHIEDFLNSLQQEQPEVDLEKEIDKTVSECTSGYNFDWDKFARHFYELGLKARKEE